MTNPTNPFNWQMPTASDLVTDLPADFETFGQAVATSMADLLGGTTGQVLSKASNTDMDFTWVAQDDSNAIQNAIVDAKGDLIAASAADTPARLAVGNNGETLVADSSTSTGLRYQGTMAAGKNGVINGGMDIWQRGTSFSNPNVVYTADRWQAGTHAAATLSRQASDLTGFQYFARYQRTAGSTATTGMSFANSLETATSLPYAGKTVTLSFYAKAGANYSATGNNLNYVFGYGTGTDQNIFGTYTGFTSISSSSVVLTTSWQRFSITGTVASTATELAFYFTENPTGTAGAADYYDITGVQLEIGSVATTFTRAGGTIQGELAACQRYYEVGSSVDGWSGYAVNGSTYYLSLPFKVQKRTSSPTMTTTISQNIGSASVISQSEYGFRSSGLASATVNSAYFIFSAWNASAEL